MNNLYIDNEWYLVFSINTEIDWEMQLIWVKYKVNSQGLFEEVI